MIDMQPSADQQQIIDSVVALLVDALPLERLRPRPVPVFNIDAQAWPQLGALGIFGLGLPETYGGFGYSIIEELLVFREFGRFLVSPAVLASAIAAHVASHAGASDLATSIRNGAQVIGAGAAFAPRSEMLAGTWHLLDTPPDAMVLAWSRRTAALIPAAAWQARADVACIDSTIRLERATLPADAQLLLAAHSAPIARHAALLVSAYLVGLAEGACSASVEYAGLRQQFGQPIGAFQAVKHRCADMVTRASAAWNLTVFAGLMHADDTRDADFQTCAARVVAADAAFRNAAVNIQNHGATGYTGENTAHLYLKRSHLVDRLGGDIATQKAWLLTEPAPMASNAAAVA